MDISIIIPYNKDRGYLDEAIFAAQNQDFKGTYEIIVWHGDYGVAKNFNDALQVAQGRYIKGCAEDDLLTTNCLTDLYEYADGCDIVCAGAVNFTDDKQEKYQSTVPLTIRQLAEHNTIHGGTVLYRKSALLEVGGMNESMWCAEEFDLHLRMLDRGMVIRVIQSVVFAYRIHGLMNSGLGGSTEGNRIIARHKIKQDILRNYRQNNNKIKVI